MQTHLPFLRERGAHRGRGRAGEGGLLATGSLVATLTALRPFDGVGRVGRGVSGPKRRGHVHPCSPSAPTTSQHRQPASHCCEHGGGTGPPRLTPAPHTGSPTGRSWASPEQGAHPGHSSFSGSRQEPQSLHWEASRPRGAKRSPNGATCSSSFSQGGSAPSSPAVIGVWGEGQVEACYLRVLGPRRAVMGEHAWCHICTCGNSATLSREHPL